MSDEPIEVTSADDVPEVVEPIIEPIIEPAAEDVAPPVVGFVGSVPAWPADDEAEVPAEEEIVTVIEQELVTGEGEPSKPRRAKK